MINTPHDLKTYRKDLKKALGNSFLGATLDISQALIRLQANAFAGIDFDALSREIAWPKTKPFRIWKKLLMNLPTRRRRRESRCTLPAPLSRPIRSSRP